jgi:hypothetical protein
MHNKPQDFFITTKLHKDSHKGRRRKAKGFEFNHNRNKRTQRDSRRLYLFNHKGS